MQKSSQKYKIYISLTICLFRYDVTADKVSVYHINFLLL